MIRIHFDEQDIQALRYERFHNPNARIQQKVEALFLKSKGLAHHEICRLCEISKTTLINYLKEYQRGGILELKERTKYKTRNYKTSVKQVHDKTNRLPQYASSASQEHQLAGVPF